MSDKKDALLSNKIAAAIILSALIASAAGVIAHVVYPPQEKLANQSFILPGSNETVSSDIVTVGGGASAGPGAITDLFKTVTVAEGAVVARKCQACHDFTPGGPNKVGPNLHGIMGKPLASVAGYNYSDSLKTVGGSWNNDKMNQWLYNSRSLASGTKMNFVGLSNDKERAAIILYMRSLR